MTSHPEVRNNPGAQDFQKIIGAPQMSDAKATILIVEDEVLVRWAIADYLQDCGFKILSASSAEEAIEALRQYALEIDLVFSDIRMPGAMDGFALAAWIGEHRPDIAVVLTSGHAERADAARELCHHAGEILRKPYDYEAVLARIKDALRQRTG